MGHSGHPLETAPHLTYSTQEQLADYIPTLQQEAIDNGTIDDETITQIADLEEEWTAKIGDLGYEDGGGMETIDERVDREADFDDYAWALRGDGSARQPPGVLSGATALMPQASDLRFRRSPGVCACSDQLERSAPRPNSPLTLRPLRDSADRASDSTPEHRANPA